MKFTLVAIVLAFFCAAALAESNAEAPRVTADFVKAATKSIRKTIDQMINKSKENVAYGTILEQALSRKLPHRASELLIKWNRCESHLVLFKRILNKCLFTPKTSEERQLCHDSYGRSAFKVINEFVGHVKHMYPDVYSKMKASKHQDHVYLLAKEESWLPKLGTATHNVSPK